jgi:hypothetical protein
VGGGGAGGKTDMSFCGVLCQWPMLWIRVLFFFLYVQGLHGAVGVGHQLLQNSLVRPREQKSAIATNLLINYFRLPFFSKAFSQPAIFRPLHNTLLSTYHLDV